YAHMPVPVITRGDGCYVYDEHGKRYLDGLSALYCVNVGHGRAEIAEAAARQARELGFYTNWSYAHPPSIALATRIAQLAPASLNRVFFTSGGSEAVESAWKLAKAYHAARGESSRHKLISRVLAYHGSSMGALTATGLTPLRTPFEPLTPGGVHVPNTNSYRWPEDRDPLWAAHAIEEAIAFEGAQTVAAVILEPVQNGGGCFVPQDGYFQRVREGLCAHVRANEGPFREMLESLRDLPIVGDVRGAGYFQAIELVKDRDTKETFDEQESEVLLREFLSGELYSRGLICRTDDRG